MRTHPAHVDSWIGRRHCAAPRVNAQNGSDAAGVAAAVRFQKAEDAAAARQARIEAGRMKRRTPRTAWPNRPRRKNPSL